MFRVNLGKSYIRYFGLQTYVHTGIFHSFRIDKLMESVNFLSFSFFLSLSLFPYVQACIEHRVHALDTLLCANINNHHSTLSAI